MSPNADATRDNALGTDRRTDYQVRDPHSGRTYRTGLSRARARSLAREYASALVEVDQ
jgi:hypothetical protein